MLLVASAIGCGQPVYADRVWGTLAPMPASREDHPMGMHALDATQSAWSLSRGRLSALRDELPRTPYVEHVHVRITDPRTKSNYEARGAVAISPGSTARMILVGPAGTTALDLWVRKDRFRFAVPAIHLEKRGAPLPERTRGLPVGFFRWWFLSPLGGRLLAAHSRPGETFFLLKDDRAIVTVRAGKSELMALRREGENVERISWLTGGLKPCAGAHGKYIDERTGLVVDVIIENVALTPPDPAAFDDPDESQGAFP
jgi:hypothetical protein